MIHSILDLKVVYISPDHNEKYHERKLHMDSLLRSRGFKNAHHYKSEAGNYPNCCSNALRAILEDNLNDEPVLVIEDDVELTGINEITIPNDADAIYLGLATNGWEGDIYLHTSVTCPSKFESYSDTQVKVLSMLGGHAVLYTSKRYKERVIKQMELCVDYFVPHMPPDLGLVLLQQTKEYHIYANKVPLFYQSNQLNKDCLLAAEDCTKIKLNDSLSFEPLDLKKLN